MRSRSIRYDRTLELTFITSELKYGSIVFDAGEVVTVDAEIVENKLQLLALVSCKRAYLIVQPRASPVLTSILQSQRTYFVLLKEDMGCLSRALGLRLASDARYTYDYFDGVDLRDAFPHIREPLADAEDDYSDFEEDYASQVMNGAEEICFEAYLSSLWMDRYLLEAAEDDSAAPEVSIENEAQESAAPAGKPRPPQDYLNAQQMQAQAQAQIQAQAQVYAQAIAQAHLDMQMQMQAAQMQMQAQMQAQAIPQMFYPQAPYGYYPPYAGMAFAQQYQQLFATQKQLCQQVKQVFDYAQQQGQVQISPQRVQACTTVCDFQAAAPQGAYSAPAAFYAERPAAHALDYTGYPAHRTYRQRGRDERDSAQFEKKADGRRYSTQGFKDFMEDFMRQKSIFRALVAPFVSFEAAAKLFEYAGGRACYKCENSRTGKAYCVCEARGYKTTQEAEAHLNHESWVGFFKRYE